MTFTANLGTHSEPDKLKYYWSISRGSLAGGQGTSRIRVRTAAEDNGLNITAAVKIEGLPPGCSDIASEIAGVGGIDDPELVDEFSGRLNASDLKARIDNMFVRLQQMPDVEGMIAVRFNRSDSRGKKLAYLNSLGNAIYFLRKDPSRVTFLITEGDSEMGTRIKLLRASYSFDAYATPGSILIKGEELKAKLKTMFKKKDR